MARLISVKNKKGILWNLPTVLDDWYVYVIQPGEMITACLRTSQDGQVLENKTSSVNVTKIKAWCRLDGDMNEELVQPEDVVIVDEFLREV